MARWMRDYTVAETNTPKTDKNNGLDRPWQKRRTSDRWIWLSCMSISLISTALWFYANTPNSPQQNKPIIDSIPSEAKSQPLNDLNKESLPKSSEVDHRSIVLNQKETDEVTAEEAALRWWIDAAPRPDGQALRLCLEKAQNVGVEIYLGEGGLSILTQGRQRPQIIYEQNDQIWIKTPLLNTAHQQAYDHLLLISCLKSPGATLYDPLLVRQWNGEDWPQANLETGALVLDDLFLIRSQGEAHFTYGLFRLGLSELGLQSKNVEARNFLRRLALFWIVHPNAREKLQTSSLNFKMKQSDLQLIQGKKLVAWLGPKQVRVLVDQDSQSLSNRSLKKLLSDQFTKRQKKSKATKKGNLRRKRRKTRRTKSKKRSTKRKKAAPKQKTKPPLNLQYR